MSYSPDSELTTGKFAKIMKVSPVTVINWIENKGLPAYRIVNGPRKIKVRDARAFLERNKVPMPDELRPALAKRKVF